VATITLLHTNDIHGKLTPEKAAFLSTLRSKADLYFDTGDCVRAGNLAIPVKPDPAWELLAACGCDASVPGNRESHPLTKGMRAKFTGVRHEVVCANWADKRSKLVFNPSKVWRVGKIRVAAFGVMVPIVTKGMATQAASQYLWDPPIPVAVETARELRNSSDIIIALTHIGLTQDKKLAEATEDIDIILGGHSHSVLQRPEVVNGTPICQGGSHARFIGRYVWELGKGLKEAELVPWP
jgi:5'-nucleotidase